MKIIAEKGMVLKRDRTYPAFLKRKIMLHAQKHRVPARIISENRSFVVPLFIYIGPRARPSAEAADALLLLRKQNNVTD